METLFLTGYVVFIVFLNILALLISAFYQKKFNQPAPKAGFVSAILLAIVFILFSIIPQKATLTFQIISALSLLGSGAASIGSILYLFFTMRRVRK
jgi:uncharacterized membrane protein YoaK (UPF0700 family)